MCMDMITYIYIHISLQCVILIACYAKYAIQVLKGSSNPKGWVLSTHDVWRYYGMFIGYYIYDILFIDI